MEGKTKKGEKMRPSTRKILWQRARTKNEWNSNTTHFFVSASEEIFPKRIFPFFSAQSIHMATRTTWNFLWFLFHFFFSIQVILLSDGWRATTNVVSITNITSSFEVGKCETKKNVSIHCHDKLISFFPLFPPPPPHDDDSFIIFIQSTNFFKCSTKQFS